MKKLWKIFGVLAILVLIGLFQNCSDIKVKALINNSLSTPEPRELTCSEDPSLPKCNEELPPNPPSCEEDPTQAHCEVVPPPPPAHPYRFTTPNNTVINAGDAYTLTWVAPDANFASHFPNCTPQVNLIDQYFYNVEIGTGTGVLPSDLPTGDYTAFYRCNSGTVEMDRITIRVNNPNAQNPNTIRIVVKEYRETFGATLRTPTPEEFPLPGPGVELGEPTSRKRFPLITTKMPNGSLEVEMLSVRVIGPPANDPNFATYGEFSQNPDNGTLSIFFSKIPGDTQWSVGRSGCAANGFSINWKVEGTHNAQMDRCVLVPGEEYYVNIAFIDMWLARQGIIRALCGLNVDWNVQTSTRCDFWGISSILN